MKLKFSFGTIMIYAFAFLNTQTAKGQVGINTSTPDNNSVLDIVSSTKGVLVPRFNQTQANTLAALTPVDGMLIYNSTLQCIQIYKRTSPTAGTFDCLVVTSGTDTTNDAWVNDNSNGQVILGTQSDGITTRPAGTEFVAKNNGNVGLGTSSPTANFHVNNNTTAAYLRIANFYAPSNTTSGNASVISLGTAASSKNEAQLRYVHQASGDDNNRFDIGWNNVVAPSISILANGNVGIGETAPSARLEVNGNVEIQTVNGVSNDNPYKPLVWNTTTKRVEATPSNGTYINKTTASIAAAGNSGTIYTFDSGTAYEVKVYYETPCSGMFYNKFFVVAANLNNNSAINYVGGVSQNGAPVATITNKTTISMANPYASGCGTGDSTSNFNYTITVGASTGELSITNNGTTAKSYRIVIEKIFD